MNDPCPDNLDDEGRNLWSMASDVIGRSRDAHVVMTALWIRHGLIADSVEAELRGKILVLQGTIRMAVDRLGGIVEGRPTHAGNFLQRIDELVRKEVSAGRQGRWRDERRED